jgi:hypothetical protein
VTGEIGNQLRHAQMAGAGIIIVLALAILGFVWTSIWAVEFVAPYVGGEWSKLVIGLICLAPLFIFLVGKKMKAEAVAAQNHQVAHPDLAQISHIAQGFVEKSPMTALAIAALAGILAAKFPSALTLLLQVLSPPPQRA